MCERRLVTNLTIGGEEFVVTDEAEFPKSPRPFDPLIHSIQHWKNILSGDEDPGEGCSVCAMCQEYAKYPSSGGGRPDCSGCPLYINGTGCLDVDSAWRRYQTECEIFPGDGFTDYISKLTPTARRLAEQILANLEVLAP